MGQPAKIASRPVSASAALIHNDYKLDNLVLDPGDLSRVVGVLDWEMATVGDPLMDLGTALSYWFVEADGPEFAAMPFGLRNYPGAWSRARLVERYTELSGRDLESVDFYHVFGLFKTAVVAQQIYYRFKTGKTDDPRFELMILGVDVLAKFGMKCVEGSEL